LPAPEPASSFYSSRVAFIFVKLPGATRKRVKINTLTKLQRSNFQKWKQPSRIRQILIITALLRLKRITEDTISGIAP